MPSRLKGRDKMQGLIYKAVRRIEYDYCIRRIGDTHDINDRKCRYACYAEPPEEILIDAIQEPPEIKSCNPERGKRPQRMIGKRILETEHYHADPGSCHAASHAGDPGHEPYGAAYARDMQDEIYQDHHKGASQILKQTPVFHDPCRYASLSCQDCTSCDTKNLEMLSRSSCF